MHCDAYCSSTAAGKDDDADDGVLSSVIVHDVVFISSLSVDWLSRTLYWVDSAKASIMLGFSFQ